MQPLPALTRAQSRAVDRLAEEELGLPTIVLMENAGRGAAELVAQLPRRGAGPIAILCGPGANGGDGCVVARHLVLGDIPVHLFHTRVAERLTGDAALNRRVVERLDLRSSAIDSPERVAAARDELQRASLFVDALLGTGAQGAPRTPVAETIRLVDELRRASGTPVVALDLPSGLDADGGRPADPTLRADRTLTFCAPKLGFGRPGARAWTGPVEVVSIGVPRSLVERVERAGRGA